MIRTLFDDVSFRREDLNDIDRDVEEVLPVDKLKDLESKIAAAVEKVKALKDEKEAFEQKIKDLEMILNEKNREIESLRSEKTSIKNQVEELLGELETLEI